MATNYFLPFGVAAGANSWSDATYNGSQQQQTGIQKGIVPSGLMTKAWRQSTVPGSALGQIIVDHGLLDAADDGNMTGFKANLRLAIAAMLAGAPFAVDQSSAPNLLTVVLDPAPPTLATYRGIFVRVANTNTGAVTLTLNNLGNKPVVRKNGLQLAANDLNVGQFVHLVYDLAAGQWVVAGSVTSDTVATATTVINNLKIAGGVPQQWATPGVYTLNLASGITFAVTECRGAGGGGGGANSTSAAGSGGGGGGNATKTATTTAATILKITVGQGGAGGSGGSSPTNGTAGGTTSVTVQSGSVVDFAGNVYNANATLCAASGGGMGYGSNSGPQQTSAGTAGVGSGGDMNQSGDPGGFPYLAGPFVGGAGGGSPGSGGQPQVNYGNPGNSTTAAGVGGNGSSSNGAGGPGGNGRVTIQHP